MLSEKFINTCFDICVSVPTNYSKCKELFSSIYAIFNQYLKDVPEEQRPLESRLKVEFIVYLAKLRYKFNEEFTIDRVKELIYSGKYSEIKDLLIVNEQYKNKEFIDNILIKTILPKRKSCHLGNNIKEFKKIIESIESGSFEDIEELIESFENAVHKTHSGFQNINRIESVSSISSLDLLNGDYSNVLDRYKNQSRTALIRSGFDVIDDTLPFGGFEAGRIYMFGGETGVGKSIMLINILSNTLRLKAEEINNKVSVLEKDEESKDSQNKTKQNAHIYITAENLIDESLIRYYCTITKRPHYDVVQEIKTNPDFNIKQEIIKNLKTCDCTVLFYYVPSKITTISDIEAIINESSLNYNICSLFLDYLDLIESGTDSEFRIRLGEVTSGFKRIAILNNIPVITATQLNRSGYNNSKATITSMSESMNKANDTDFLAFLQRTDKGESHYVDERGNVLTATKVRISILKNRGGTTDQVNELILEKKLGDKFIFNYCFKQVPKYREMTEDEVKEFFDLSEDDI